MPQKDVLEDDVENVPEQMDDSMAGHDVFPFGCRNYRVGKYICYDVWAYVNHDDAHYDHKHFGGGDDEQDISLQAS